MMSSSPYRLGLAMILLSSLALVLMAWRGVQNHRELVWIEAKDEAALIAERFQQNLEDRTRVVRIYDYPPKPGTIAFDPNASLEDLREQMTSNDRTKAGLPVAVLAAYEVTKRSKSVRDGEQSRNLAMIRWPDITSPLILERLATLASKHNWEGDFSSWKDRWQADEAAREVIQERQADGWSARDDQLHCIHHLGDDQYSHVVLSNTSRSWKDGRHFEIELSVPAKSLGNVGYPLIELPMENAALTVGIPDAYALESEWRSRRNETLYILGFAGLVIGFGIWMMRKSILYEQKLSHSKGQFIASVTHELRAPVGAIRLMADTFQSGKISTERQAEFHQLLARESARLSVLIENVMDLAKVENGKRVLNQEIIQLDEIIAEVCEMMQMQAQEAEIQLKHPSHQLKVKADPVAMRQILVNLIDNAIKFSPAGSVVTLDWGEGWWFSVADQGPGIPDKDISQIFDRFFRGGDELRRETKGVGIGLSLVQELTELHDGKISVSNQQGAVFKVDFSKP